MDPAIQAFLSSLVPPAAASALVVALARLLAIGWLREQKEFRERVEKHMEETRSYPEFRTRMEDRSRRFFEVEQKVTTLGYEIATVKTDVVALRGDVKDGMRDLKAQIDKLSEKLDADVDKLNGKLDELFRRAFGQKTGG